ncbi:MAG: hemerythrin domain-containing protein [Gammaproteobacteria bacterium]|nr:hemerythrin domain-containing protein [Gammaproteobacteria bacterium]
MDSTIEELHKDHKNIAKLLNLLKIQTEHLQAGDHVDSLQMTNIMNYFINYPDIYHHPNEEFIFDYLKQRDINTADLIDEINSDHQTMASAAIEIQDEVRLIMCDAVFSRENLADKLNHYISAYFSHIDIEENELFPLVEKILDDEDWQFIHAEIKREDDPLFGEKLNNEYEELYKAILNSVDET